MDGPIIGYVRISAYTLARPHGCNLDPIWAQKMFFCLILQGFCDFLPEIYFLRYY